MTEKVYKLTRDGYKQIEKKLKFMRTHARAEVAERIRQAKEFGQLEENTEYENAKAEQAKLEQEILKLEKVLRNAVILDKSDVTAEVVDVGTTVTVEMVDEGKTLQFELVSTQESDPSRKIPRISDESPVGGALMNKKRSEMVEVEVPLGKARYKVIEIINTP
jgi:transcription elongation factor GreA